MVDLAAAEIGEFVDAFVMGIEIGAGIEVVVGIAVEDLEIDMEDDVASAAVHMMLAPIAKHWLLDVAILMGVAKVLGLVVDGDFARCLLVVGHSLEVDEWIVLHFALYYLVLEL